ncbi:MAG: DUF72 domain-containing protein [Pedobacter sp.]
MSNIYSGTSGLLLPVKNKFFYPEEFKEKSRLCYYGSLMNSIEINSSFYKVPMASTVQKWADDVPFDFKFTFKLFREITHNKELLFNPDQVYHFMNIIDRVGDKKGCLLIQFPPSIKINSFRQFGLLLNHLRLSDPDGAWHMAFEFRHNSWYCEELYELLAEHKMSLVVHDKTPANTPMIEMESSFAYLRFHGPGGSYRGSYSDDVLYEYATYIREWQLEDKKVYVYFNNTMGNAIDNRNTLLAMLAEL